MCAFRIRVFVPHSNDNMGPRVARGGEHEKNIQVQSKDILIVEDLRKEVHCSMQVIVQTRWVIKRPEDARRVSGLVPVSAARKR